jgi:hypothetical protein
VPGGGSPTREAAGVSASAREAPAPDQDRQPDPPYEQSLPFPWQRERAPLSGPARATPRTGAVKGAEPQHEHSRARHQSAAPTDPPRAPPGRLNWRRARHGADIQLNIEAQKLLDRVGLNSFDDV